MNNNESLLGDRTKGNFCIDMSDLLVDIRQDLGSSAVESEGGSRGGEGGEEWSDEDEGLGF